AGKTFIARRDQVTATVSNGGVGVGGAIPVETYPDGTPALWSRPCLDAFGVTTSDGLAQDLDGNELPNTPNHSITFGVAYTWQIPALSGSLTARWDYYWQDDAYAREFNTKGDEIDAWDHANAQMSYTSTDGHWKARAFVRNLQDEDNVTGKYLTSDTSGFYRNYFLTEPRIYGLSVKYDFGGQ
ncbi:MAG: TonB-dependent receptor, partial [Pseudomonadales bacterium]|nr:TonB-dependent receptor [Pseudomonadales bacterium]